MKITRPAQFPFDEVMATQIAAHVITVAGENRTINYTKLIKLMYMIERRLVLDVKRAFVGGSYVSMDNGPLSSEIYDLIKNPRFGSGFWHKHLSREDFDLRLIAEPGTSRFSKLLRNTMTHVLEEHGHKNWQALAKFCHDHFQEWQYPFGSSLQISYESMFDAEGLSPQIEALREEANELYTLEQILECR